MKGYIDGYNFAELDCMKYWQPPASWTVEKKKMEVRNRIFSGDWYGARKVDGALYVFLKDEDGNVTLRGRSKGVAGEYLDKWDHLPQLVEWANKLPNGTCLLGEVYRPDEEGSKVTTTIMGCLTEKAIERQKDESKKMHYYVFDVLAFEGENWLNKRAEERFNFMADLWREYPCKYVDYAEYLDGEYLWNILQETLADGYEGIVITHKDAKYEPGKRPSKTTMKVKQELRQTIDCVIMGWNEPTREYTGKYLQSWTLWYNTLKNELLPEGVYYQEFMAGAPIVPVTKNFYNGWAGSLRLGLYKDGNLVYFGDLSGLTEEVLSSARNYVGRVVEVGGMQIDKESHRIRHPRLISWRDKDPKDCNWEQVLE